ncbi:hypothetical protein Pcinc_000529 [Petrolisthes cinctipes]|uniref:Uncharacterized protein n=1 Tax=Petrolisthes cinctipes TaxID=88211 RepID=A0AAE1L4B5_PETCI|nr:hypothetical protein Pcinc_000529 [Petrolisthes cinctipes]
MTVVGWTCVKWWVLVLMLMLVLLSLTSVVGQGISNSGQSIPGVQDQRWFYSGGHNAEQPGVATLHTGNPGGIRPPKPCFWPCR